jgi:hypothetical protein
MSVRGEAMSVWKGVRARVRALMRRRSAEREQDDEIAFHIEMETEKHQRRGLSPEQARRQALLSFGGRDRVREQHRDVRGFPRTERLWQDVRHCDLQGTAEITPAPGRMSENGEFRTADDARLTAW